MYSAVSLPGSPLGLCCCRPLLHDLINKAAEGGSRREVVSPTLDFSTGVAPLWDVPCHRRDVRSVLISPPSLCVPLSLSFPGCGERTRALEINLIRMDAWLPMMGTVLVSYMHDEQLSSRQGEHQSWHHAAAPLVSVLPRLSLPGEKTHAGLHACAIWYSSVYSDAFMCVYSCKRQACELSTGSQRAEFSQNLKKRRQVCVRVCCCLHTHLVITCTQCSCSM